MTPFFIVTAVKTSNLTSTSDIRNIQNLFFWISSSNELYWFGNVPVFPCQISFKLGPNYILLIEQDCCSVLAYPLHTDWYKALLLSYHPLDALRNGWVSDIAVSSFSAGQITPPNFILPH
jgi:hypothetical protein